MRIKSRSEHSGFESGSGWVFRFRIIQSKRFGYRTVDLYFLIGFSSEPLRIKPLRVFDYRSKYFRYWFGSFVFYKYPNILKIPWISKTYPEYSKNTRNIKKYSGYPGSGKCNWHIWNRVIDFHWRFELPKQILIITLFDPISEWIWNLFPIG